MESKKFYQTTLFLWVCGILIPVVGIILLWTVHKNKSTGVKVGLSIVFALWFVFVIALGSGDTETKIEKEAQTVEENTVAEEDSLSTTNDTGQEDEESEAVDEGLELIYDKNEAVNRYLNKFNEANPDDAITSDMISPHCLHNGNDVESEVQYYVDGFEVIISGASVYVGYTPSTPHTDDDYKEMFIKYMRGFDLGLSDEELSNDWDKLMESHSSVDRFDKYTIEIYPYDYVSYFKVTVK